MATSPESVTAPAEDASGHPPESLTEKRMRLLLEHALDAFISVDAKARIVEWNPQAEHLTGWKRSDAVGRSLLSLVVPRTHRRRHLEAFQQFLATGEGAMFYRRLELTALHKSGRELPVEVTIYPLETDGEVSFCGFVRDLTERKQVEAMKDNFLATVGHELRTPLTTIQGFTELMLQRNYEPERRREFLTVVHSEIQRLKRMVDDLLSLDRLRAGRLSFEFEEVDLTPLLREIADVFRAEISRHRMILEIEAALPRVRAARDRIHQVLFNLLDNAIKFSPEGGEIRLEASSTGREVTISVSDQGVGVPEGEEHQLFERFYRGQRAGSSRGSGLGLALVREIVEAHRGRVWTERPASGGSRFSFTLPV